jgi:hypothetical protein
MDLRPKETISKEAKRPFNWWSFAFWPFVIVLLYVLSSGPVVMMYHRKIISDDNRLVWTIYDPLFQAADHTSLGKVLGLYLHLWDSKDFGKDGRMINRYD